MRKIKEVLRLRAQGLSDREIQGHLKELYEVEVSPTLISAVTDAVLEDVRAWQARTLDAIYPIVYLDAIHMKLRTAGHVQSPGRLLGAGHQPTGPEGAPGALGR